MRERLPAWARARVGARVAAVRAYLTRAVGGAPSARRARPARRLWIDAGCVAGGGGCSIDFARAPASRGGCWPAIARGSALRDGEEARPPPGAPQMHCRSAALQAAVVRQFTPCNARARGVLRAWARPRGSSQGACQAARPSEPAGGLQRRTTGGRPPVGLQQRGAAAAGGRCEASAAASCVHPPRAWSRRPDAHRRDVGARHVLPPPPASLHKNLPRRAPPPASESSFTTRTCSLRS